MATVLCMKWGTVYGPEYVNNLYSMAQRNLSTPCRFVCLTDDTAGVRAEVECRPLPAIELGDVPHFSGWRKLSSFSRELADLSGPVLFLDLDLILVGNIDCFFAHEGDFCIIENWTQLNRGIGNSSVYRFEAGRYHHVLDDFEARREEILRTYDNEQMYLSAIASPITFWPAAWCKSFKRHCLPGGLLNWIKTPTLPSEARIIVFHGHPKPPEAAAGIWPKRFKKVRPTPWIKQHWC